jgi:hypothetical protein
MSQLNISKAVADSTILAAHSMLGHSHSLVNEQYILDDVNW